MLPGSPQKGRRRRLIDGVKGTFGSSAYATVEDRIGSRDLRKEMVRSTSSSRNTTTVFQPTFDREEHGYRIDVAQDGSMITAVPVYNDDGNKRSTAIRKSDNSNAAVRSQESTFLFSDNLNQTHSMQASLDARGNQRHKMKRATTPLPASGNSDTDTGGRSTTRKGRDQITKAHEFIPTFPQSHIRQEAKNQSSPSKRDHINSKVTWDLNEMTFMRQKSPNIQKNSSDDEFSFGSFPILGRHNFGGNMTDKDAPKAMQNDAQENDDVSFETSLQRRMEDIQSRQSELQKAMTQKDMMKGTLINAFDQNLEKNKQQMATLEDELETIRWHLSLEQKGHGKNGKTKALRQKIDDNVASNQGKDPIPAFDVESVGDPSITADTESVADLFGKGKTQQTMKRKGMDPPARPSPSSIDEESLGDLSYNNQERKDPRESRVLEREKKRLQGGYHAQMPASMHPTTLSDFRQSELSEKQLDQRRSTQLSKKTVHFKIPRGSQATNSVENLSPSFEQTIDDDSDDLSWQGGHFDADMYDDQNGGLLLSEGHKVYQWEEDEHLALASGNHIENDHNNLDMIKRQGQIQCFGISSSSVESDDLGFVHAVAAVVIQTAVRRFLAELVTEERRYAVQIIHSAAIDWLERRYLQPEQFTRKSYAVSSSHETQLPLQKNPRQRIKRVMFRDEYEDASNFAAIEIQRCFRGWLVRDTLEVDEFAATTIQRVFRGWWVRETMEVDRFCATEIQRIVRGHLCRMNYIYDLYCITMAQSVCRRFIAFNKSAVRLANVLYIQAIYRGYRVRSNLSRYVDEGQEIACTLIQTQWRRYDTQMDYINTLADILIVQSVARRWLTLRRQEVRTWHFSKKNQSDVTIYGRHHPSYSSTRQQNDAHAVWKEHRLKVVAKKKQANNEYPEAFSDILSDDGVEGIRWYDRNTSETNDLLHLWRGRKSL